MLERVQVQALIGYIVRSLVDEVGAVRLEAEVRGDVTYLQIIVHARDIGKMVGKQGRNARALRQIVSEIRIVGGHRFLLDIAPVGLRLKESGSGG